MISSGAVTLRPVRPDDLDRLYAIFADLDTWEERSPNPPAPMARENFEAWYGKLLADHDQAVEFAVEVDGRLVGRCALFHIDALARHGELGVALSADARGQGYGTDTVRALLEFGFERRNLHRIYLDVLATNEPAIACYRKAGFVEEGRLREHIWARGRYVDFLVMGLLRADWRNARPAGRTP